MENQDGTSLMTHLKLLLRQIASLLLLLHLLHRKLNSNCASQDTPTLLDNRALLFEPREEASAKEALGFEECARFLDVDGANGVKKLTARQENKKASCEEFNTIHTNK